MKTWWDNFGPESKYIILINIGDAENKLSRPSVHPPSHAICFAVGLARILRGGGGVVLKLYYTDSAHRTLLTRDIQYTHEHA